MTRPAILTEAQLRAAVAVAEAEREHIRRVRVSVDRCPVPDVIPPQSEWSPEYRAEIAWIVEASDALRVTTDAWEAIRPDGPYEVRAGETLARIVADHTDGGTETASRSRDTMLVEILREFEGLTARDGVR